MTFATHHEPSVRVRLYQEERRMLARVAKAAVDAGVAEQQARLAQEQVELIALVLRRTLIDLGVDPSAPSVRATLRRHLAAMATGKRDL